MDDQVSRQHHSPDRHTPLSPPPLTSPSPSYLLTNLAVRPHPAPLPRSTVMTMHSIRPREKEGQDVRRFTTILSHWWLNGSSSTDESFHIVFVACNKVAWHEVKISACHCFIPVIYICYIFIFCCIPMPTDLFPFNLYLLYHSWQCVLSTQQMHKNSIQACCVYARYS